MFVNDEDEITAAATTALAGNDEQTTEATVVEPAESTDEATETDNDETDVSGETDSEATAFSRAYVEKLRRENAGYRERANQADELAGRLHTALVAATGRMADPTDLPYEATHLDDDDALTTAIDELLAKKPHLATRRPFGDVGQGRRGAASEAPVNLADMLRARA